MENSHHLPIDLLHDLAFLYFGLAHGADDNLDPEEVRTIAIKLHQWQPNADPALIEHAVREASLSYMNGPDWPRLKQKVEVLGQALPGSLRMEVLDDLAEIARADGIVKAGEMDYIEYITESWSMDYEAVRRS